MDTSQSFQDAQRPPETTSPAATVLLLKVWEGARATASLKKRTTTQGKPEQCRAGVHAVSQQIILVDIASSRPETISDEDETFREGQHREMIARKGD